MLAVFLILILPSVGLAQTPAPTPAPNRFGLASAEAIGLPSGDLRVAIIRVIQVFLGFLGFLAVIMIMYGGFIWSTSGGDPAKIDKAKKILINTIIGLIIILSSYIITAFIFSLLGRGAPSYNPHGDGGPNDFGRWGIGVGSIESVYPAPNAIDVPINTLIAVTFKEIINPETICGDSDCSDGADIIDAKKNVEICEVDMNRDSADYGDCVAEGTDFDESDFESSTIRSNDNRTFTIMPPAGTYLGQADFTDRKFKVNLKSGIETVAEPGKSVFDALVNEEFAWQFTTNGELDLDPPEVIDIVGVYPYPDDTEDTYSTAQNPTPTKFELELNNVRPQINPSPSVSAPVDATLGDNTSINAQATGNYSGTASGNVTITINSSDGKINAFWPVTMTDFTSAQAYDGESSLNIGPYGLTFSLTGVAERGNSWTFPVTAFSAGDKLDLLENGILKKSYTFGVDITDKSKTAEKITGDFPEVFESYACPDGFDACLKTKATGASTQKYSLQYYGSASGVVSKTDGDDLTQTRTVNGRFDTYRNTIVQINFNEAINPSLATTDYIIVKHNGTVVVDTETNKPNYSVQLSNQYKTIEIIGPNECGQNSCGDKIYCWPVNGDSEEYEVEIISAKLMDSTDGRCATWAGPDADDGHGRCVKDIGGVDVFYPLSTAQDGITDMSLNSFNGSLDYYTDPAKGAIGNSQGKSGAGNGQSGRNRFELNGNIQCEKDGAAVSCNTAGSRVVSYGHSMPIYGGTGFGDNFAWWFHMSNQIDNQAPLLDSVQPTGDEQVSGAQGEVSFGFDRIMRSSTLKPGWNYGSTNRERTQRYLILQTISQTALPIGYWARKTDLDDNLDGWADYTKAFLNHHSFDLNVKYGPLAGSGVQSITQNCYLPSQGPKKAVGNCSYDDPNNCVEVELSNPASYGYLNCAEIKDATVCSVDNDCKVLYYDPDDLDNTNFGGSWVITKDFSKARPDGRTTDNLESGTNGCCLGVCVAP